MVDIICTECKHPLEKYYPRDMDQGSWGLKECDCGCTHGSW